MAVLAVGLVLGSGYATRDTTATRDDGASAYLPQDGTRRVARVDSSMVVSEDAVMPGRIAAFAMPGKVNLQIISKHQDLIDGGAPLWRQTTTSYGGRQTQSSALFAVTDRGLVQLAYVDEKLALVLDPAAVVLPPEPEDGQRFTSEGDALGGLIDYRSTTALRRDGECWRASGSFAFIEHESGRSMGSVPSTSRLCPGRGLLQGTAATPPRPRDAGRPAPALRGVGALATSTPLSMVSPSPVGEMELSAVRLDVPPVATGDGRVVLADSNSRDLLSLRRAGRQLTLGWRAHPGGVITSLTAVGDIVVVGTSGRDLCAYDADGGWLWCRQLGDLVDRPGVVLGSRTLATVGQDGVLRALDALSGKIRWRVRGVDTRLSPVRVGSRVVVAGRDGAVGAWWSRTGKRSWTAEDGRPPETVEVVGDEVVVLGELATRYDATGRRLAQHVLRSSVTRSRLVGDLTVVTSSDGTAAFDRAGKRRWSGPQWRTAASDGAHLLTVSGDIAQVVDVRTGEVGRSWRLPHLAGEWWVVPVDGAPVLVHSGGTVVALS